MLSKKHFNKMAEIIANEPTGNHATQNAIHAAFMQLIEAFPNPRFDRQKFNKACKAHEIHEGAIMIEYIPNTQYSGSPYPLTVLRAEHPNSFEIYARERFIGKEDPDYRESFVWRSYTSYSWEALRDMLAVADE
jgi:hypothetical protein|tara:strand:+ start:408 stop:809 length:402 start_codon:yes stop_codon:yes gene_type:complete